MVNGDAAIIYGDSNKVNANRVMIMGDSATVDHDDSWVINMATSSNVKTTASIKFYGCPIMVYPSIPITHLKF